MSLTIITERRTKNRWTAKAELSASVPVECPTAHHNTEAQAAIQVLRQLIVKAARGEIDRQLLIRELDTDVIIKRIL